MITMLFSIFSCCSGVRAAPSFKRRASRTLDSLKDPSASLSLCMVGDNLNRAKYPPNAKNLSISDRLHHAFIFTKYARPLIENQGSSRALRRRQRRQVEILRFITSLRSQSGPCVFQPTIHSTYLKK